MAFIFRREKAVRTHPARGRVSSDNELHSDGIRIPRRCFDCRCLRPCSHLTFLRIDTSIPQRAPFFNSCAPKVWHFPAVCAAREHFFRMDAENGLTRPLPPGGEHAPFHVSPRSVYRTGRYLCKIALDIYRDLRYNAIWDSFFPAAADGSPTVI